MAISSGDTYGILIARSMIHTDRVGWYSTVELTRLIKKEERPEGQLLRVRGDFAICLCVWVFVIQARWVFGRRIYSFCSEIKPYPMPRGLALFEVRKASGARNRSANQSWALFVRCTAYMQQILMEVEDGKDGRNLMAQDVLIQESMRIICRRFPKTSVTWGGGCRCSSQITGWFESLEASETPPTHDSSGCDGGWWRRIQRTGAGTPQPALLTWCTAAQVCSIVFDGCREPQLVMLEL